MIMNFDDLYIVNYRETGGSHLQSIMRLPKEEAFDFAGKLSQKTTSRNNRYGDYFDIYYNKRLRTEEWLYNAFVEMKGEPNTKHPIYFTLLGSERLCSFFGNDNTIKLPLKEINSAHISFTPRDSMHLMDMGQTQDTVWKKEFLEEILFESEKDILVSIKDIPENYGHIGGYIEAQLWNDIYVENLLIH